MHHFRQVVSDPTQVGEARRLASRISAEATLDDADAGRVAIVVTELAGNLVKHAGGGELLIRSLSRDAVDGVEIISVDKGPGMDVLRAEVDGYSTSGTPGTGLGAVRRQSDLVEMYSIRPGGTAILAQVWRKGQKPVPGKFEYGLVNVPVTGELVCGDSWLTAEYGGRFLAMIVDGLGHGHDASVAAAEAVRIMREHLANSPCEIVDYAHLALKKTRGAAMSVFEYAPGRTARYAGVGNVAGVIWNQERTHSMVSHNGTLGAQVRRCHEFEYPFTRDALLIMYSDGLSSQWDLKKYPGLSNRHPALIASVLYRDFRRTRDDVTVLVARERTR